MGPGVVSKTLSSPPSSGSIGTTRNDSWSRSEMSPPFEYEMNYYRSQEGSLEMARLN